MAAFLTWIAAAVIFMCPISRTCAHGHSHSPSNSPQVLAFRQKWGVKDIVRDIDHIKEDLSQMIELQKDGMITSEEALFYFFRMHDFDDNEKLDGIELVTALGHTASHAADTDLENQPIEKMADIIDSFLQFDVNADGFVSYTEMKTRIGDVGSS